MQSGKRLTLKDYFAKHTRTHKNHKNTTMTYCNTSKSSCLISPPGKAGTYKQPLNYLANCACYHWSLGREAAQYQFPTNKWGTFLVSKIIKATLITVNIEHRTQPPKDSKTILYRKLFENRQCSFRETEFQFLEN
jgi:hypothetical protein